MPTISAAPPVVCNHPDDVAEVRVTGDYLLFVRFHDGTSGTVDLAPLIGSANDGVFAELRNHAVLVKPQSTLER